MNELGRAALGIRVRLWPIGILPEWIFLSVGLVVVTAALATFAVIQAVSRQVETETDRRLVEGTAAFKASLQDKTDNVLTVARWLASEPEVQEAISANDAGALYARMADPIRLPDVDEVLVARPDGSVLASLRADGSQGPASLQGAGFFQSRVGRPASGIGSDTGDLLQLESYVPIGSKTPSSVIRVASFLDAREADRFRARTGLEVSLFFGRSRLVTTLRDGSGQPLASIGPNPDTYRDVVADGRQVLAWRELSIGRLRSYSTPLAAPDATRVGMMSVQLPVEAIQLELRDALWPVAPVAAFAVGLAALTGFLLLRRAYQPVLMLAQAAGRLREGDLTTPVPTVTQSELLPLAEELERARVSLHRNLTMLAMEEARQRTLVDALHDPLLTTDLLGRIITWNSAAARLFGQGDVQRLRGAWIQTLLPFINQASEEGSWQGRLRVPDGRSLDVQVSRAILPEGPLPASEVYVLHDVSSQAELNRLRERLLFHVAHELRGPVTVLDNALDILSRNGRDRELRERMLPLAVRSARQVFRLSANLLSAANIQAGRFVVHPEPIGLAGVIGQVIETVSEMVQARSQHLSQASDLKETTIMADPEYLQLALSNLVTNASKYSPEGATIQICVEDLTNQVRISVEDNGPGIPPEQQKQLFEPFYRGSGDGSQTGLGLGLSIVKEVIDAHGGVIGVQSEPGAGSTFWFTVAKVG